MNEQELAESERQAYIAGAVELARQVASGFPHLTAGELKRRLDGVPDDAPVLYQRIEDEYFERHNWKAIPLIWESEGQYSDYIHAFGAHKHKAADGRVVFVVNAHY